MNGACETTVRANRDLSIFMLGTRAEAASARQRVEEALARNSQQVCLDFSGVDVTQSFVDELVGVLVLRYGPKLLERLAFVGCTEDTRAIVSFVIKARARDFTTLETTA